MDIVNILSAFLKSSNYSNLLPLFELLEKNSFDLKKTFQNLDLDTITPLITNIFNSQNEKTYTETFSNNYNAISPIEKIADNQIVAILNSFIDSPLPT